MTPTTLAYRLILKVFRVGAREYAALDCGHQQRIELSEQAGRHVGCHQCADREATAAQRPAR